jgi:hypothetical protein
LIYNKIPVIDNAKKAKATERLTRFFCFMEKRNIKFRVIIWLLAFGNQLLAVGKNIFEFV